MVHVGAVFAFDAAALDVEFTQLFDEVIAALNVLQLAVVPLQTPADTLRTFCLFQLDKPAPATAAAYLDAPAPEEVAAEQAAVQQQRILLLELLSHQPPGFQFHFLQSKDEFRTQFLALPPKPSYPNAPNPPTLTPTGLEADWDMFLTCVCAILSCTSRIPYLCVICSSPV